MNKLVKSVSNSNLYYEFLQSLNGILKLTDRELELFAALLRFDVEYVKVPNKPKNIANTANRKWIIDNFGITRDNLSRYLRKFREEGFIVKGRVEGELTVARALIPVIINDRVQITIILKVDE